VLDKPTAPKIGSSLAPTMMHGPALDAVYTEVDSLFVWIFLALHWYRAWA
jgi:hypothetical protein